MFIRTQFSKRKNDFLKRILIFNEYIFDEPSLVDDKFIDLKYLDLDEVASYDDLNVLSGNIDNIFLRIELRGYAYNRNRPDIKYNFALALYKKYGGYRTYFTLLENIFDTQKDYFVKFSRRDYYDGDFIRLVTVQDMIMDFLEINENTLALAKRCNVINENYVI
jgi:hypothetical protein